MTENVKLLRTGRKDESQNLYDVVKTCVSALTEVYPYQWSDRENTHISEELVNYWNSDVLQSPVFLLQFDHAELNAGLYFENNYFLFNASQIKSLKITYLLPAKGPGELSMVLENEVRKSSRYQELNWPIQDIIALNLIQSMTEMTAALNWQFRFEMANDV
ncbi:MAG: hypothetical protein PHQ90_08035 [Sulfuricurvum sp.]|nr:hypothetical protein [Sulfuricurvum sp.]